MIDENNLYSYMDSIDDSTVRNNLKNNVKKRYFFISLILIIFIPIDFLFFIVSIFLHKKKSDILWVIEKRNLSKSFEKIIYKDSFVTLGTILDINKVLSNRGIYFPVSFIFPLITLFFYFRSNRLLTFLSNFEKHINCFLEYQNKYLIVNADFLPYQRTLIFFFKRKNFTVVNFQHGKLNQNYFGDEEIEGQFSDVIVVRSIADKNIIKSSNPAKKIIVFPSIFYDDFTHQANKTKSPNVVVIIGEGWQRIDKDFFKKFCNEVKRAIIFMKFNNINYIYKPHPSHNWIFTILNFSHVSYQPINKLLHDHNIFLGYDSTVLLDAIALGKTAYSFPIEYNKNVKIDPKIIRLNSYSLLKKSNLSTYNNKDSLLDSKVKKSSNIMILYKRIFKF